MNDLQDTTIEKAVEHLGRELEAINHFESAKKDLRDKVVVRINAAFGGRVSVKNIFEEEGL